MKKKLRLASLVSAAIVATVEALFFIGGSNFSNVNVFSYLEALVNDLGKGGHAAACQRVTDDATFSLADSVSRPAKSVSGGKNELCNEFVLRAITYTRGLEKDSFYKADLKVRRDLFHWSRATVTYNEHHDIQKYEVATPIRTVHRVRIVLEDGAAGLMIKDWNEVVEADH